LGVIKKDELVGALEKKGFKRENRDHIFFFFYVNGRKTSIRTMVSHNDKMINDWLQTRIAKQMGITKPELDKFVECSMTQDIYCDVLVERKKIMIVKQ